MRCLLAVFAVVSLGGAPAVAEDQDKEFTNMWIAEIHGGEHVAKRVARDLGYTFHGQTKEFEHHYILKRDDHEEISKRNSVHLTRSLTDLEEVKWAEQQSIVKRSKRGYIPEPPAPKEYGGGQKGFPYGNFALLLQNLHQQQLQKLGSQKPTYLYMKPPQMTQISQSQSNGGGSSGPFKFYTTFSSNTGSAPNQDLSKLGKFSTKQADAPSPSTYKGTTKHVECLSRKRSAYEKMFNDPLWTKQWYAQDYRTTDMPVMDHNIVPVYKMGYTGTRVKVAVVDDGLQHGHPDLKGNHLEDLSYDMCNDRRGSNPDASTGRPNSHGTKCAGEIAMVANNNKCGVGVAYNCKVIGVKVLGRRAVDFVESRGLVHGLKYIDIYSNSWGPQDDGKTMDKIGRMSALAIEKGVTEGRNGKGSIYTFAGGNGRHSDDNCAADGMINNPYTIGISSVSQRGKTVYYSERCSAIYAGAYSGGNQYDEQVASIDMDGGCTTTFSGTSAATPLATGILALTLDANPNLTYRDVFHLIAMSSEVAPVADNEGTWYRNGKGFWVSNDFGFGLLNAENMVTLAKTWKTVPEKKTCIVSVKLDDRPTFTPGQVAVINFDTEGCQDSEEDAVKYLEQVEVACTLQYPYRGAVSITIKSPAGTKTVLLEPRPQDSSREGLNEWSIKSLHQWGEDPNGSWEIVVKANPLPGIPKYEGTVEEFIITFHGTSEKPAHYDLLPRKYAGFRLPDGKTNELLKIIVKIAMEILYHMKKYLGIVNEKDVTSECDLEV